MLTIFCRWRSALELGAEVACRGLTGSATYGRILIPWRSQIRPLCRAYKGWAFMLQEPTENTLSVSGQKRPLALHGSRQSPDFEIKARRRHSQLVVEGSRRRRRSDQHSDRDVGSLAAGIATFNLSSSIVQPRLRFQTRMSAVNV